MRLHEFTEIRAPAAQVWSLLIDWAGMLRWPPGSDLSGYVASAYVDEIDDHTCALHITSWFDARTGDAAEAASTFFGSVYRAIFKGFRHYFA